VHHVRIATYVPGSALDIMSLCDNGLRHGRGREILARKAIAMKYFGRRWRILHFLRRASRLDGAAIRRAVT
jgi:hypothetical protein